MTYLSLGSVFILGSVRRQNSTDKILCTPQPKRNVCKTLEIEVTQTITIEYVLVTPTPVTHQ